tara:strand:+ start:2226 stop:3317 length:1092 start_codon:yes stop_codon:yes gene_type:complete
MLGIISLKYAPGLYKELNNHYKLAKNNNISCKKLLNFEYRKHGEKYIDESFINVKSTFIGFFLDFVQIFQIIKNMKLFYSNKKVLLFYNFHPLNILISLLAKKSKIFLYIHEPYMPEKSNYGFLFSIRIQLLEFFQTINIKLSDLIFVPSQNALKMFELKYPKLKHKCRVSPLLLLKNNSDYYEPNKKNFVFVGRIHKAKNFSLFLNLVEYCFINNLNYNFLVISISDINSMVPKEILNNSRFTVISKDYITDSEIENAIRDSYALIKLDSSMTQSGLVAQSMMLGTPVIANDIIGFSQHISNGLNGFLINLNRSDLNEEFIRILELCILNKKELKINSLIQYEKLWSGSSWMSQIGNYIKDK